MFFLYFSGGLFAPVSIWWLAVLLPCCLGQIVKNITSLCFYSVLKKQSLVHETCWNRRGCITKGFYHSFNDLHRNAALIVTKNVLTILVANRFSSVQTVIMWSFSIAIFFLVNLEVWFQNPDWFTYFKSVKITCIILNYVHGLQMYP